jgi:hypothetical protein
MKFNKHPNVSKRTNNNETITKQKQKQQKKSKKHIIKSTNTPTKQFETIRTITNASKPIKTTNAQNHNENNYKCENY